MRRVSTTLRTSRTTRAIYGAAAVTAAMSLALPHATAIVGLAGLLAGAILLRRRLEEVGALMLLLLPALFISAEGLILRGWILAEHAAVAEYAERSVAAGTLTVPAVVALLTTVVLAVELVRGAISSRSARWWILLWIAGSLVAFLSAYQGYASGQPGWSAPLRTAGVYAAFFWAASLGPWSTIHRKHAERVIQAATAVAAAGLLIGVGTGNGVFLMTSLVVATGAASWFSGRRATAAMCWSVGLASAVAHSFTVLGIAIVAAALFVCVALFGKKSAVTATSAVTAGVVVMGVVLLAAGLGGSIEGWPYADTTLAGEFRAKLFEDRSVVWRASTEAIVARAPIAPAATQQLYLYNFPYPTGTYQLWESGTHNAFLELALQFGYLGAVPFAILLLAILLTGARCAAAIKSPSLTAGLCAAVAIGGVGHATGHFIVRESFGVLLMLLLGLGVTLRASDQPGRAALHEPAPEQRTAAS